MIIMHLLFVYGTLKAGYGNNRRLGSSSLIGHASTEQPMSFVDLGSFPALVPPRANIPQYHVKGELYEVDDHTLEMCDRLEGHPTFYTREEIGVVLDEFNLAVDCWAYILKNSRHAGKPIKDIWPPS